MTEPISGIANLFEAKFRETLRGPRTIGREAEYTIVKADGEAANAFDILPRLQSKGNFKPLYDNAPNEKMLVGLEGQEASYSTEVGLGTIEVITGPCQSLFELKERHENAMRPVLAICKELGFKMLGYGIQPKTPAIATLMSPKQRYQILLDVIGKDWLYFCITSSDQAQVDIKRDEIIKLTNFGILMAPVVIAVCANSSVCGNDKNYICHREGLKKSLFPAERRHGMIDRPYNDIIDFVSRLSEKTCLMLKKEGQYVAVNRPLIDVLGYLGADLESFLMHDHYFWNSARARAAHSTVEIRPACQQPWNDHMVVSALVLGLIEGADEIQGFIDSELGGESWRILNDYHNEVVKFGLAAKQPKQGFLLNVISHAYNALMRRGLGEEVFLKPIFDRLKEQLNPGQKAKKIYQTGGLKALIDSLEIPYDLSNRPL